MPQEGGEAPIACSGILCTLHCEFTILTLSLDLKFFNISLEIKKTSTLPYKIRNKLFKEILM